MSCDNPLKRLKDGTQGYLLLDAVRDAMPQFPLDEAFAIAGSQMEPEARMPGLPSPSEEGVWSRAFAAWIWPFIVVLALAMKTGKAVAAEELQLRRRLREKQERD